MMERAKSALNVLSDTKTRSIFIIILVIVLIAMGIGYVHLKRLGEKGAVAGADLSGAPANIGSVPGAVEPTRAYAELQEKQNIQVAQEALKKQTASVMTPIRTTYLSSGVSSDKPATGCSVEELTRARNSGVTASELRCRGCSLAALKAAGFTAGELRDAGFSAKELKDAGFTAAELKDAGFSAKDLKDAGFSAADLKAAGFSAAELKDAGFSTADLKAAGYADKDLADAAGVIGAGASSKDCSVENLRKLRGQGISPQDLKNMGCSATTLKAAGFTAAELKAAGFSAKQLKDAGFSAADLKAAGFSAKDLKDAGFSAKDLKDAGFSAKELKDAGFSAGDLRNAGFSAKDLKDAGFSAKDLKNAGFSAADLKDAGFSAADLKAAGYSDGDLMRAGFKPSDVFPVQTQPSVPDVKPEATTETTATPPPVGGPSQIAPVQPTNDLQSQLEKMRQEQAKQLSTQEYQAKVKQVQQTMSAQANDLFSLWIPLPTQQYAQGATAVSGVGAATAAQNAAAAAAAAAANTYVIKAGTIMFAVLDTGVNSDEKSPIMASIVDGELKGSRVLGDFERTDKKVVLRFGILSKPDLRNSVQINAVAIDPNTARTAIATHVDNHYWLRYGMLFASSFASGVGQAVTDSAGSIQVNTSTGENVNFSNGTNVGKAALIGLGEVGNRLSSELEPIFNKPPTVEVKSGSGIGVLLMSDLTLPLK